MPNSSYNINFQINKSSSTQMLQNMSGVAETINSACDLNDEEQVSQTYNVIPNTNS